MTKNEVAPITSPDAENTDPKYWEKVLHSHGLAPTRGKGPKVIYVGGLPDLQKIANKQIRKLAGKVFPGGRGPDSDE